MIERVAVWGAGGMLGRAVTAELRLMGVPVLEVYHHEAAGGRVGAAIDNVSEVERVHRLGIKIDAVINCAGLIPARFNSPVEMARANAVGPHVLNTFCTRYDIPLFHVSTDCVFDGKLAPPARYAPLDALTARDHYGRTKIAGESSSALVVRTSFIGPDHGVLAWLLQASGVEPLAGYERALWTGSTVWAVARALARMVVENAQHHPIGIEHLATADVISKADVLELVNQALGLGLTIERYPEPATNRALVPTVELPPFEHELAELARRCRRGTS